MDHLHDGFLHVREAAEHDRRRHLVLEWRRRPAAHAGGDMDPDDLVRGHYGRDDLEAAVTEALQRSGVDVGALQLDDLATVDELHAGFRPATEHVLDSLALAPGMALLDVGSGVGGPARLAAARNGCRVTGIDLSPAFVGLARSLTARLGLAAQVAFDVGSATELPYPDGSFARAMSIHAGMNIADKPRMFAEVRRVLEPGGLFAVYDQMRTGDGELPYPLPWADDEASSFVETRARYRDLLERAGFAVEHDEDRTPANATGGPPRAGALSPGVLFGPDFDRRLRNNVAAAATGTLSAVLMVARAA
jgi:SAM-dependent methyltransferase